jgi:lipoprotein-releasing system permease protein
MSINVASYIGKKLRDAGNSQFSGVVTQIAVVSVAFSVVVLLVSFAILEGFKTNVKNNIVSFSSHIQVSKFDVDDNFENVPISSQVKGVFDSINGVKKVQAFAMSTGILKTEDEVHGVVFKGIGRDFYKEKFESNILQGKMPKVGDTAVSYEILISKLLSNKLKINLNDNVIMYFITDKPKLRKLKVVGIYETGMTEFDDVFLVGDINVVRGVNKWSDSLVTGIEIFVDDFDDVANIGNKVFDAMPNDMQMEVITEKYMQIFDWFKVLDLNVVIFITIIISVAGFNIVSTIVVMIMERTSMIGILKSLGASNNFISKVFFFYGLNILSKGLLWGNVIGLSFCALQYFFKVIPLDPENYFMTSVPIEWTWGHFVIINILITILISLALLVPLLFIRKVKPIVAIKFD